MSQNSSVQIHELAVRESTITDEEGIFMREIIKAVTSHVEQQSQSIIIKIPKVVNTIVKLTKLQFASIRETCFLCDELINVFLSILQERSLNSLKDIRKSIFIDCKVSDVLLSSEYASVCFQGDIFEREHLYVPVQFLTDPPMYVLCVITMVTKDIAFYNFRTHDGRTVDVQPFYDKVIKWLRHQLYLNTLKANVLQRPWNANDWKLTDNKADVAEDYTDYAEDTGVYMLACLDYLSADQMPLPFESGIMKSYRRVIGSSILRGKCSPSQTSESVVNEKVA